MAKAKRQMEENLKRVDSLIYVLDARAPFSCINPEFDNLIAVKPVLYILNKSDLVDPATVKGWCDHFSAKGMRVLPFTATGGKDGGKIIAALYDINREKIERNRAKGVNYAVKAMVIGMPNTGKSTVINALCKGKRTVTGNKPGVTKGEQWVRLDNGISLLDTPGTLSNSMKSTEAGLHLAYIGAVRDAVVDTTELALELMRFFVRKYPQNVRDRYGIEPSEDALLCLSELAKKRGLILRGGEPDVDKAATAFIEDYRKQRLGKIALEKANEE